MWKKLIVSILPILALADAFVVLPEDEILKSYKSARAALTPEQQEFLMELLAADDALIETTSRGIVDDILQALSGTGGNIRVNLIGGSPQQQNGQNQNQQPAVNILNPTFTIGGPAVNNQEKALLNSTDANTLATMGASSVISAQNTMPMSDISSPSASRQSIPASGGTNGQAQMQSNVTTIGGNNNHLFSTISSVIRNSNSRNVTGIVDESLRIATPAPIREFVTGILQVVYCNGIRRLLGRC